MMVDTKAFHTLSYGLYIVSAKDEDGVQVGCVANTFAQVASEPPMVSVSLNKDNVTTSAILATKRYNVSVLSQDATMDLIGCFGFRSSYDLDKFAECDHLECSRCIPYINEHCVARFCVEVKESVDVGTHILFIGEVIDSEVMSDAEPMTYSYYHKVLRGKTPPKAASFDPKEGSSDQAEPTEDAASVRRDDDPDRSPRYGWRCTFCGYIVEMNELPDDFTCPICGMGKEFFERIEL